MTGIVELFETTVKIYSPRLRAETSTAAQRSKFSNCRGWGKLGSPILQLNQVY